MTHRLVHLLLTLVSAGVSVWLMITFSGYAHGSVSPTMMNHTINDLVPLPRECKGINPPGSPDPICCVFGYVISDGVALNNVVVTLYTRSAAVTAVAAPSPEVPTPHYHFSLSDLGVSPGDVITLSASIGGRSRVLVYPDVARGGQQADLVLSAPDQAERWTIYATDTLTSIHALALEQDLIWAGGDHSAMQLDANGTMTLLDNPLPASFYHDTRAIVPDGKGGAWMANWGGGVSRYAPFFPWVTMRIYNSPLQSNYLRDARLDTSGNLWLAGASRSPMVQYSVTIDNRTGLVSDLATYQQDLWTGCPGYNHTVGTTLSRTPPNTDDVDWALWKLPVALTSGEYDVSAYIPNKFTEDDLSDTASARYRITSTLGVTSVNVSQTDNHCRWVHLGRYTFTAGANQGVYLGDYTGFENPPRQIYFDAIKWQRVSDGAEFTVDDSTPSQFIKTSGVAIYTELNGYPFYNCRPPGGDFHWFRSAPLGAPGTTGQMIWRPELVYDGPYQVEATSPQISTAFLGYGVYSQSQSALWKIYGALETQVVTRTQQVADGCAFQSLGQYVFNAGDSGKLVLGNYTGENPRTVLVGDAARWVFLEEPSPGGVSVRLSNGSWITYTMQNSPLLSNDVWSVLPRANGDVWLAGAGGLSLRHATGDWITYTISNSGLPFTTPTALAEDPSGRMWIASQFGGGLASLNLADQSWQVITSGTGLPFDRIAALAVNTVGGVYLGSAAGAGLAVRKPTGQWVVYTPVNSLLPGGRVEALAVGQTGDVWIAATAVMSGEHTAIARLVPGATPIATMNSVKPNNPVQGNDIVVFRGAGSDQDDNGEQVVRYEWRIDRLPDFITTSRVFSLPASALPAGINQVSLRVIDDEGQRYSSKPLDTLNINAKHTWLFMLYLAGDNDLDDRLAAVLPKMDTAVLPPNVTVVIQLDGRGPNDTVRRVYRSGGVSQPFQVTEQAMNQPATLVDFIAFARTQAPTADSTYLALADHGRGTEGIALDETSSNTMMSPAALREALRQATNDGANPLDVLHLDACLMALFEQASEVAPYARYLVASQNLSYSAFAYDEYTGLIGIATSGRELAAGIAISYAQIISDANLPYTISALDLSVVPTATSALNNFATALSNTLPAQHVAITQARASAQHFDSRDYYTLTLTDEYLDLFDFVGEVAARVPLTPVQTTAAQLREVISSSLVIVSWARSGDYTVPGVSQAWWNLDRAQGVSIFLPPHVCSYEYGNYLNGTLFPDLSNAWPNLVHALVGAPPTQPCGAQVTPPPLIFTSQVFLPVVMR